MTSTTLIKQTQNILFLSQTEKIYREKVLTSLESISSLLKSETDLSLIKTTSLMNMIIETVQIIHQLSKY